MSVNVQPLADISWDPIWILLLKSAPWETGGIFQFLPLPTDLLSLYFFTNERMMTLSAHAG